ncbi:unnamed protein product [Cylindrotheca closterium]|uniref:Uncharacterized protein n=1 Tax=Cylindrotheca closterium TaxID=2856 RepID=A0AAD2CKE5_9STRA|nr:unnamed protein product [Cylindrotheca closterium]
MGKPKVKAIKCFSNSKDNKLKRLEEQEMAKAIALQTRRTRSLQQQQQQQQRGRQGRPEPEYIDYSNLQQHSHQHQQQKMNHPPYDPYDHIQVYRPSNSGNSGNPASGNHHQQPPKFDMNALSGLRLGRSKSVPPELRQHFAVYNMYGNENEEEKIMEFSTDNSITSSRKSLTGNNTAPKQQQQRHMTADQRVGQFQARIKQIQNELALPPVKQISIQPEQQYQQQPQHYQQQQQQQQQQQPLRHKLPNPRSKTPEPVRSGVMDRFRSKTPDPRPSSGVPTTILRTQRYHAEKIVTPDGNIMLKKKIVHVNRTRPCVACGFRDWSQDDMAYLLVRQTKNDNNLNSSNNNNNKDGGKSPNTENSPQPQVKWLCPDCACDNGLPKEHYHWNKNRLPPVPDPVIDITMNRAIGPIDADDIAWVQKAQRKPKPMNWKSQYSDYYSTIRKKQRQKQAMCCAPPPPEEYSDAPEDEIRRAIANACFAPDHEQSDVGETCYNYVGDL